MVSYALSLAISSLNHHNDCYTNYQVLIFDSPTIYNLLSIRDIGSLFAIKNIKPSLLLLLFIHYAQLSYEKRLFIINS